MKEPSVKNFYLLPRGVLPPNPADLLMSRKMHEVLNELRNTFDFVLIDSPPAIAVSDAAVISAFCDGVLLVFHGQRTTAQAARQAVERLDSINATLLGVILNGVDIRNPDYVDYRSYYPSYYESMQKELKTKQRPDDSWAFNGAKDEEIIGSVEDLDLLMRDLGFHKHKTEQRPTPRQGNNEATTPSGIVPPPFLNRMATELSESVPNASTTVSSRVSALGESMKSFPMARIWELTQLVGEQIPESRPRMLFLRTMAHQIRALYTQERAGDSSTL